MSPMRHRVYVHSYSLCHNRYIAGPVEAVVGFLLRESKLISYCKVRSEVLYKSLPPRQNGRPVGIVRRILSPVRMSQVSLKMAVLYGGSIVAVPARYHL
jgi:hypothetical protein